jgi:4a-hydroxytetrahydrobiopterin dehydratase
MMSMTTPPRKLSEHEIATLLVNLPGWRREGDVITRELVFAGFAAAAAFPQRIVPLADAMDHHPDLLIHRYKRVKITLTTHSAGGLTENDFILAAKIDALAPA